MGWARRRTCWNSLLGLGVLEKASLSGVARSIPTGQSRTSFESELETVLAGLAGSSCRGAVAEAPREVCKSSGYCSIGEGGGEDIWRGECDAEGGTVSGRVGKA